MTVFNLMRQQLCVVVMVWLWRVNSNGSHLDDAQSPIHDPTLAIPYLAFIRMLKHVLAFHMCYVLQVFRHCSCYGCSR